MAYIRVKKTKPVSDRYLSQSIIFFSIDHIYTTKENKSKNDNDEKISNENTYPTKTNIILDSKVDPCHCQAEFPKLWNFLLHFVGSLKCWSSYNSEEINHWFGLICPKWMPIGKKYAFKK